MNLFNILFVFSNLALAFAAFNTRAVIGVISRDIDVKTVPKKTSLIEAAYVKSLEASGARIVPILIHQPKSYYQAILNKINGVLFSGDPDVLRSKEYIRTGKIIYDMAVQMNGKGDYFPLFGIGLGFDLLTFLVSKKSLLTPCSAKNLPTNLIFPGGLEGSRMWKDLENPLKKSMEENPVNFNYHSWCLTQKNYTESGLNKSFKVLALSKDSKNETFISAMEGIEYPFYGITFHPEKVQFNFVVADPIQNIPHTLQAIRVAQFFPNFFVDEARKSGHLFPSLAVEDAALIYNYAPAFTGKYGSGYINEQIYFF